MNQEITYYNLLNKLIDFLKGYEFYPWVSHYTLPFYVIILLVFFWYAIFIRERTHEKE